MIGEGEERPRPDDGTEPALSAEEARDLREAFHDLSIAPLGRNYFGRYREVRDALDEMVEAAEGPVSPDHLREHLDAEDFDFMASIVRNLDTFASQGLDREGSVEPYTSARDHADRLEPFLDLLRPHLAED